MANYMSGPEFKLKLKYSDGAFSFADVTLAARAIEAALGNTYRCEPEGISEGGFLLLANNTHGYKSFRMFLDGWPWINSHTPTDHATCRGDPKLRTIFPRNHYHYSYSSRNRTIRIDTHLKAFEGAPRFTRHEIDCIISALLTLFPESHVIAKTVPTDKRLINDYNSHVGTELAARSHPPTPHHQETTTGD